MDRGFLKAGHPRTLLAAFLYFDVSFMVWVLLGPLGIAISHDLHLNSGQKGLLVAMPVLAGALLRVVAGALVDHYGPRRVAIGMQSFVIAGLAATWVLAPHSYAGLFPVAFVLGVAGASFAVALPLASGWYPPQYQARHWVLPGLVIPARRLPPCSRPGLRPFMAGPTCSGWPRCRLFLCCVPLSILPKNHPAARVPALWRGSRF